MKITTAISIIATALGISLAVAQDKPAAASAKTGAAAMRQAAEAKEYLFLFIYEQNDDATKGARKTFDSAVGKLTPAVRAVAVDRSDPGEKEFMEQFKLSAATPMPQVLAIAPNGVVTGAMQAADVTEAMIQETMASSGMQQCLKALQGNKLLFVCLQNSSTRENEAAMKGVNEFKADPQYATEVVKVDPADPKEAKLITKLQADPKAKTAVTAFLAPGIFVTKVDGATSKAGLQDALKKAMARGAPPK